MTVDEYFSSVERRLRRSNLLDATEHPITCLASDDFNGLLRRRALCSGGGYLDIYEVVSTELGYPVRVHYAYTLVLSGERVFRYDNAPHHPELATHPHHKHIGADDRLVPTDQPTLGQVLAEAYSWLSRQGG